MMSIERNGTWRYTGRPSFGRTWAANYFEWTVLGWCIGVRLPRIRKGTPPPEPMPLSAYLSIGGMALKHAATMTIRLRAKDQT